MTNKPAMMEFFMIAFERRIRTQAFWDADQVMIQFAIAMGETAKVLKDGSATLTKTGTLIE